MANPKKSKILDDLRQRFGDVRKLQGSESLFVIGDEAARIYFRYSKVHTGGRTFFGLREVDLRQLEGHNSYLCFLLDDGSPPLFVPFADFEEIFANAQPAKDGQYKAQLFTRTSALELYISRQGRFNVEGMSGLKPSSAAWKPNASVKRRTVHTARFRRSSPELGMQKAMKYMSPNTTSENSTGR